MSLPRKEKDAKDSNEKDMPVIKDDYGYIVNPYVPKFISKTPWYAEKAEKNTGTSTKPSPTLRTAQKSIADEPRTYDEKHDRWSKYDEAEWKPSVMKTEFSAETENEKGAAIDPYSRTCSRNLRIREDVVKYLDKSNSSIAESYDPKSRSLGIRDPTQSNGRGGHFAWDEGRKNLATSQHENVDEKSYGPVPKRGIPKKDDRRYNY